MIFFDALPINPVQLEEEVMTPHYQEYYQQERPQVAPGDWYVPFPYPFLPWHPGKLFSLPWRHAVARRARSEGFSLAFEWLAEALSNVGAGAKTAAGYGRFAREENVETEINKWWEEAVQELQQREAQKKKEEAASPVKKEMMQDGYDRDQEAFMRTMGEKWLKKLAEEQSPAEEKHEIALLLKEWYLIYREEQWKKPNKKNKEKIALIKKVLGE